MLYYNTKPPTVFYKNDMPFVKVGNKIPLNLDNPYITLKLYATRAPVDKKPEFKQLPTYHIITKRRINELNDM